MTNEASKAEELGIRDALDHSWAWFELHASQRMNLINYFLVATAFLAAAYVGALQVDLSAIAAIICLLGVVSSVSFHRVEVRTRDLVKLGEAALDQLEAKMVNVTGIEELMFTSRANCRSKGFTSYGWGIRALHFSTTAFFLSGLLYATWSLF